MRTTLTLDEDVAKELRVRVKKSRVTLRQLVNQLLRKALGATSLRRTPRHFQVTPVRSGFRRGVNPERLKDMLCELDIAALQNEQDGTRD